MAKPRLFTPITFTFNHRSVITPSWNRRTRSKVTRSRHLEGYRLTNDPRMPGEVLLQGIKESA